MSRVGAGRLSYWSSVACLARAITVLPRLCRLAYSNFYEILDNNFCELFHKLRGRE